MKKWLISSVLIACLLICYLAMGTIATAGGEVILSSAKGSADDEIHVTVSLANNPGIATFRLSLDFDKTKLLPVSIAAGEAITVGTFTSNAQDTGDLSSLTYVSALWVNPTNITNDGILYTVKFKIKDGAAGNTPLTITYNVGDVANQKFDDIDLTITNTIAKLTPLGTIETTILNNTLINQDNAITGGLTVKLVNHTAMKPIVKVLLSVYENDNKVVATIQKSMTLTGGDNTVSFSGINIADVTGDNHKVKISVWDSLINLTPLALAAEAPIND